MTTYLLLALGVLLPVAAVSLVVLVRAGRAVLVPALVAVGALLVVTAVLDSVLVGTGIVGYDSARILGVRIGAAPIEDFAYPVAAGLGLPALWHLLARRRTRP
ncbi:MAG TPA: lycopene cyclase domain-containing protein [Amnibacterium sp.]|nr:lycopene cyclase domain-containing protein [Amnibacterium sp.]